MSRGRPHAPEPAMTSPIDGLVERLKRAADRWDNGGCVEWPADLEPGALMREALSALKSTQEEVKRRDDVARAAWGDQEDEHTPAIEAAHPCSSGDHDTFAKALAMVGKRHGKYELVALVNWLLSRALKAEQERDEAWRAFGFEKPAFGMSLAHQIGGTLEELQVAEQERDEAVEALEPFAKAAIYFDGYGGNKANPPTDDHVFFGWPDHKVTIGHFRTASQVHARLKGAE